MKDAAHKPELLHAMHAFLDAILRFAGVTGGSRPTSNDEPSTATEARSPKPRGRSSIFLAGFALCVLALGTLVIVGADSSSRHTPFVHSSFSSGNDHASAIMDIIAGYCAAETYAGQHLDPAVLRPYLDDRGPWWRQRSAALAIRQQQEHPHTPRLVSWQVRRIVAYDARAEVDTLEVWENQERDMTAPAQAIVAVTYELHFSEERWLIWNLSIIPISSHPVK